jgi:histidinol-phosphate/aromatic aminotransferase/cobyric acid decarboxylase-like protein
VLVRFEIADDAPRLAAELARRGILVKDASGMPRLTGCLRVSAGTTAELDLLEAALAELAPGSHPAS